jgi:DNA transformation protein
MSKAAKQRADAFVERLLKLLLPLGPVEARRLFGGHGLYLEGTIFATIFEGELYLKADERTWAAFKRRKLGRLCYETSNGKTIDLPYWEAPPELLEDGAMMTRWARKAYAAALRFEARKRKTGEARQDKVAAPGAKSGGATREIGTRLKGGRAPRFTPDF